MKTGSKPKLQQPDSLTPQDFKGLYQDSLDPWNFSTSEYEQAKYKKTLELLPNRSFRQALEPGCSNGTLTQMLAARCDRVIGFDFVPKIVKEATKRCAHLENVEILCQTFPKFWPSEGGDLLILSEVAYYLSDTDLKIATDGLLQWLQAGGILVSTHYTVDCGHPRSGQSVVNWLSAISGLSYQTSHTDKLYEVSVYKRQP